MITSRVPLSLCLIALLSCSSDNHSAREQPAADKSTAGHKTIHQRGLDNAEAMVRNAELCQPGLVAIDIRACEKACGLNHSNSCANWGTLVSDKSPRLAIELYERACSGGSGIGCESKARTAKGQEQVRFFDHARYYHRVHCNQSYGRSCLQLARLFRDGLGGDSNLAAAAEFKQRACVLGIQSECN